jgi:Fur family peroxide stress response transcriptional regulator
MESAGHEASKREFRRLCRRHGLRITPQRVAIYQRLVAARDHPSATELYKQVRVEFPNITLATVNRTLLAIAEIGLARPVLSSGEPKRFDPELQVHHHFHCLRCGRLVDFREASYDGLKVPREISERYVVLRKKITLEGVCDNCQKKPKEVNHGRGTKKADQ